MCYDNWKFIFRRQLVISGICWMVDFQNLRVIKMRAFLLAWGLLQSTDFAWCKSCLPRLGYVCKEIPTSYPDDMTSLVLWLSNVGEINSTVFNNTNLASVTSLTLEKSGITAIAPGAFDKFQNLKILDLYSNDLSLVTSAWFTHKEILESLNLSSNSITALNGDAFLGLVGLHRLNLSHNQIQSISSGTFHSLTNLHQLDLSNNKLIQISVDTLRSVNGTRIRLNGNPWNCTYTELVVYFRELQRASLLENEMEVLCDSPVCLKGLPVWNVSKCVETITTVDPTTENSPTPQSTPVKPHTNWSIITSLIVVLCALVLVIFVLSFLYHRKQERKHLQTIKPFPEELQGGKHAQSDCREVLQSSKTTEFVVPDLKRKRLYYETEVILGLEQTILNNEKVSQIFQIYGTGIHNSRETNIRAKSAGPVLFRTDVCGRRQETEEEDHKDARLMETEEVRWTEAEKEQKGRDEEIFEWTRETSEEPQDYGIEDKFQRMENQPLQAKQVDHHHDEFKTTADPDVKDGEEKYMLGGNDIKSRIFPQDEDDTASDMGEFEDNLTLNLAKHVPLHQGNDPTVQPFQDSETIPYLTIGTDPENLNLEPEQIPMEASSRQMPSKPIKRVLTWPPTAAEWKKQWAQTQQVLNVFPRVIFVTEHRHQIDTIYSASPKSFQQITDPGSVLVHKSPREDATDFKMVEPLKKICESAVHSYIQNFADSQDHSELNEAQCPINHNPPLSRKVHSHLGCRTPLSEEMLSKSDNEESMNSSEDSENTKRSEKMDQTPKSEQEAASAERQSRRRERAPRKPPRGRRHQSGSASWAPPSGGSPSDDNLLVDNEYAFIDLLHEVVENHGRWTRERWRQSHMKKQKHKHSGKSH